MASSNRNGGTSRREGRIKPGTVLLKCDPLVYVGHTYPPVICDACLVMESEVNYKMKRCSKCQFVNYCNAECQRKGWKEGHRYECKHMLMVLVYFPVEMKCRWLPRLMLRLILKLQDGKDYYDELEIDGTKVKRRFDDLIDLLSQLDSEDEICREYGDNILSWREVLDPVIKVVKTMLHVIPKIKVPNDAQLEKIAGKVLGNTMEISNNWFHRVGCGIYLAGSILDHSCKPVAVPTFQGTTMFVRNIQKIPKSLPIPKVTISYLPTTLMPTEERRRMLKDKWSFHCECELCESKVMDKELRSIMCPSKRCNAEIDSKDVKKPCKACGHVMDKETAAKVLIAENELRKHLGDDDLALESIEAAMEFLKKNHFSDKHWLMLRCYDQALKRCTVLAMNTEKIEFMRKAYEFGTKYLAVARRFFQPNEIVLIQVLLDLAMACGALQDEADLIGESQRCVHEAKAIAEVCFGRDSDFNKTRIDEDVEFLAMANVVVKLQKLGLLPTA